MSNFRVQTINRHRFLVDGKGITTLVGLLGCPLQCKYCINRDVLASGKFREMTPEELAQTLMIDYCYFLATGGGVTFGGGESLLHAEAIREIRQFFPPAVCINVETSLNVPVEVLASVTEYLDCLIIDVKSMNPEIYQRYTGLSPEKTYRNLEWLCKNNLQSKCRIRIPRIPEFTTEADVQQTKEKIKAMGFHDIDEFQYRI